tara:strand:- start:8683 stop:9279 length:597 start_codon:yes stop_codon:yes gene_type:complete
MPTLHAFGDSFTFGHELSDCPTNSYPTHSNLTFAALFAKYMGFDYKCHAIGFSANNQILRQIKHANIERYDTVLVMWSFAVRYAFMLNKGYYTLGTWDPNHRWWWENVDQHPEQCLDRSIDSILAAQTIVENIGCNWTFICNNIELQNEIQYNSKWLNKFRWLFLPKDHEMINALDGSHPGDAVHEDVFNILRKRYNG